MRYLISLLLALFLVVPATAELGIPHKKGPTKVKLGGDLAEIYVPEGMVFIAKAETVMLLEQTGNFPEGNELGCLLMDDENEAFWVVISYDKMGYVKDDDAADIDADELLADFKAGTEAANEQRKAQGDTPLNLIGWGEEPRYDSQRHHLVWALIGESAGDKVVNFNTRILGREGVMSLNLICDPANLDRYKPQMDVLLQNTTYSEGKRYADFQEGDTVSEAGILALVAGGAAAAKLGFFAKIGKFLVYLLVVGKKFVIVIILGAVALVKNLFNRGSSSSDYTPLPTPAETPGATPPPVALDVPETPIAAPTVAAVFAAGHQTKIPGSLPPLHAAVKEGDADKVMTELAGESNINDKIEGGLAPIHITALAGVMSVTDLLVKQGADVNEPTEFQVTPLFLAVCTHNLSMAGYLLSRGAKVNFQDGEGRTPLHWAAAVPQDKLEGQNRVRAVTFLLENGADPTIQDNDGKTALELAQLPEIIKLLTPEA